ncbi:hypothetical protein GUA46_07800 [Muricauda sp. HICW]|uniref:Uncharacterized protein n=1 Tax=Flagellimonas chongwuensis TaxID=2697365 RepID=A0A850NAI8_9FLAO|nr:hypothetical protein [Allomuricauda chongwuensis]NVN18241.1 hypothetical protein [Allomuricauda chongwuensis]
MLDKYFKRLNHKSKGYQVTHRGQQLSYGYKPDLVLVDDYERYIILESEHGTSRKHFIGGMIKAAHFLTKNNGVLIFVILVKKNTTEEQIANHLSSYLKWIKSLTKLRDVYVLSDLNYCSENEPIELLGKRFKEIALKVEV